MRNNVGMFITAARGLESMYMDIKYGNIYGKKNYTTADLDYL